MTKTRKLVLSSLLGAMVFVATMFMHLPVAMTGGYVHLGDGFIYLASSLLPLPYAVMASAIGSALADAMGGYTIYVIPTLIIKALMCLAFSSKSDKLLTKRNILASVLSGAICAFGYFVADSIIYGNIATATLNMVSGVVQPVSSIVLYLLLGTALDRVGFKKRFNL